MSTGTFQFALPADRLNGNVSITVGAQDPAFPLGYIQNGRVDQIVKLTTGDPAGLTSDFGVVDHVDAVGIFNHNFDAGTVVSLYGSPYPNWWTSNPLALNWTVPPQRADGRRVNLWANVTIPYPDIATRGFRYWHLVINTPQSHPIAIGEWALYRWWRDLDVRNIQWGSTRTLRRPAVINTNSALVRRSYDLGTTLRTLDADFNLTNYSKYIVEYLFRDAHGMQRPFMIVPHRDENDAWFVTLNAPDFTHTREAFDVNTAKLSFAEQSPGPVL